MFANPDVRQPTLQALYHDVLETNIRMLKTHLPLGTNLMHFYETIRNNILLPQVHLTMDGIDRKSVSVVSLFH